MIALKNRIALLIAVIFLFDAIGGHGKTNASEKVIYIDNNLSATGQHVVVLGLFIPVPLNCPIKINGVLMAYKRLENDDVEIDRHPFSIQNITIGNDPTLTVNIDLNTSRTGRIWLKYDKLRQPYAYIKTKTA